MSRRTTCFLALSAALSLVAACSGDTDSDDSDGLNPDASSGGDVVDQRDVQNTSDTGTSSDAMRRDTLSPEDTSSRDGGSTPPDETDTSDAGDEGNDASIDGGVEADGSDSGESGPCSLTNPPDSDSDGINDCDEKKLGTDPNDGDTDGDGLSDFEELQEQTDPTSKDTDNDGASDREELKNGLDPTDADTYDDGTLDGNRWMLKACDEPKAESVDFYKGSVGNWTIALRPAFDNYRDSDKNTSRRGNGLTINGVSPPVAAAIYGDPANEVAGFLLSTKAENSSPEDALRQRVKDKNISKISNITQPSTGGNFDTHDNNRAARGKYLVELPRPKSTRKIRDQLLFELAEGSFQRSDVQGLPNSAGARYRKFQISVSVIHRDQTSGAAQSLISVGVAPGNKYENRDKTKSQIDDLTNTTSIAERIDAHLTKCTTFQPGKKVPKAEFYWVLDQSGSMDQDNQKVADFSSKFEQRVRNTALRYRLGVTNMDKGNKGRLDKNAAWHKSGTTFSNQIQNRVIDCSRAGSSTAGQWECSGSQEHGLEVAEQGIRYMGGLQGSQPQPFEAFRNKAQVVTIFMSDERPNTIKDRVGFNPNPSDPQYQNIINNYIKFFKGRTTAFSIVTNGQDCGNNDAAGYRKVALGTQGKSASLCANDLTKTIRKIIFAATGLASNYVLPQDPISTSLRVYLNGTWVPRSRDEGFAYFAERNSIAFFGKDFIPRSAKWDCIQKYGKQQCDCNAASNSNCKVGEFAGDFMAVHYETYVNRCKEDGDSSSCNLPGNNNQ